MEQFDALEAVTVAIGMEKAGHKFYTDAVALASDQSGKEMFARLANDELAHLYWLMTVRQSLMKTGKFGDTSHPPAEEIIKGAPTATELPVFPLAKRALQITPETSELDALEMGIQAEQDSIAFYREAAEMTDDADGRALFQRLADWEDDHLKLLEAERDYLARNGFYLGIAEFHLEGPEYLGWWRR